jgi:hypothetical protein
VALTKNVALMQKTIEANAKSIEANAKAIHDLSLAHSSSSTSGGRPGTGARSSRATMAKATR